MAESLPNSGAIAFDNFTTSQNWSATISSVTTEETFYDADNLLNPARTKRWRSTSDGSTDVVYYFDGETVDPTFFAIIDSNLADDKTITLTGASDSGFTTSVVSWTLTTHQQSDLNKVIRWYLGTPDSGSAGARAYWKVNFPSYTTTEGYHTAGVIWLGTYRAISPSSVSIQSVHHSKRSVAYGGTIYSDRRQTSRRISFRSELMTFSDAYNLKDDLDLQSDDPVLLDLHGTATTDALESVSGYYGRVAQVNSTLVSSVQNGVAISIEELRQ